MTGGRRWPRSARVAAWSAALLAAVVLPLFRQQGVRPWRTIWAEDGGLYAPDVLHGNPLSTIFRGYAGYAQAVPRLLALAVPHVPLERLSVYFALAGALTTALIAAFTYRSLTSWINDPVLRLVVPALAVLAPVLAFENTANVVNTIWIMFFAAAMTFVSREEGTFDVVVRCVVAFLAATSIVLVALVFPFAFAVTALRRKRADVLVFAALVVGLAVQATVLLHTRDSTRTTLSSVGDLPGLVSVRLFGSLLVGDHWVTRLWSAWGSIMIVVFTGVFIAIAFLLWAGARHTVPSDRADRWMPAMLAATALVAFVVPFWLRGTAPVRLVVGESSEGGARYVVVPLLLLVTAGCILADRGSRMIRRLIVAQTVVVIAFNFLAWNPRSAGPFWPGSVSAATATCQVPGTESANLPISPITWNMPVDCSDVPR